MTEKIEAYRHGDLLLLPIKSLPEGLKKTNTRVLLTGSHDNEHKIGSNADVFMRNENEWVTGYLNVKKGGTKLTHPDHGDKKTGRLKECNLPEGYYQLRHQTEETPEGLKPVID